MSHSYAGLYGYGTVTTKLEDTFDRRDLVEPTHIRLHAYYGGERNGGACTMMSIGEGHSYEAFGKECSIHLTKKDVALLIKQMSAWLANVEGSDDYGTMPEIDLQHKPHPDNDLTHDELAEEWANRDSRFCVEDH